MANDRRFLLGKGELLARQIEAPLMKPTKVHPYTFAEAQSRLAPEIAAVTKSAAALPAKACPSDNAVMVLTLHPAYLAKSYYPDELLRTAGMTAVGSRERRLTPAKVAGKGERKEQVATDLFVAAKRSALREFSRALPNWNSNSDGAGDLIKVEEFSLPSPESKVSSLRTNKDAPLMEVVLHAGPSSDYDFVIEGFKAYLDDLDVEVDLGKRLYAGQLCFLPVRIPRSRLGEVAKFSYLRVTREMPRLRSLDPKGKPDSDGAKSFNVNLPKGSPTSKELRIAVFDGGVPQIPELSGFVNAIDTPGVGDAHPDGLQHGLGVTSAVLFGSLKAGEPIPLPPARVDHYRVLDKSHFGTGDSDLFEVLDRIVQTLTTNKYDLINLSIGPEIPIEDREVHAWTAKLDELLADGSQLATVAVGNGGDLDHDAGNARIQPPSDSVNALSVGAADSLGTKWARAGYSCIGPGRSPGLVKPDLVAFGGNSHGAERFYVLNGHVKGGTRATYGTSFAAPSVLRAAASVRVHMGHKLSPLAIKALLVHRCEDSDHPKLEVGWGRLAPQLDDLLLCAPDEALVVYQGSLEPAKWLRVPIPLPKDDLTGMVQVAATFCFTSRTDPQDPVSYTRSGLEIRFRPNAKKFTKDAIKRAEEKGLKEPKLAQSKPFFGQGGEYETEHELREDAQKWETMVRGRKRMQAATLNKPVFDVHYVARSGGGQDRRALEIPYALIVTIRAPKVSNLYNLVATAYPGVLEVLNPVIEIPIRP